MEFCVHGPFGHYFYPREITVRNFIDAAIRYIRESDIFLLILCVASSVYGIILISSVTRNTPGVDIYIQIISLVLGIALYVLFSFIDIDILADKSIVLFFFSVLFISTLFVWGVEGGTGNKAWLRFFGIGVQPAEVVKIPFTIIMAKMIVTGNERKTLNSPLSVLRIMLVFGAIFGLIIVSSADLGSALVYIFILLVMLFIGGLKLRWFALGAGFIAALVPLAWNYFLTDRQIARILAPFDPARVDPTGQGITWQANQSKMAISAGEFFGRGLYKGPMTQNGLIPMQRTDFILSAAGEELGFVGCLLIIALLVAIIIRCVYVGVKSNNLLGLLVCVGIASMLIVQTFENIGMCLGLSPVIGLTLPFFSYGGSSIVTNFAAMGIISGIKMRPKPIRFRNSR